MASGRHPDDFWPRTKGWDGPAAESPESHGELSGADDDELLMRAFGEEADAPMKRPSARKPALKRPADSTAMKKPSRTSSKPSKTEDDAADEEDLGDVPDDPENAKNAKAAKSAAKPRTRPKPKAKKSKTDNKTRPKKDKDKGKNDKGADKSKGCAKCRWKSGCKACGWRGIVQKGNSNDGDRPDSDHAEPEEDERP